jgi:hypothetical protein
VLSTKPDFTARKLNDRDSIYRQNMLATAVKTARIGTYEKMARISPLN